MTIWQIILLASILVLTTKLLGYLVPPRVLAAPTAARTAELTTVALLSALIVVQTIGDGQGIAIDARLPALGVAAVLFALRVPFVGVVIAAAATAAGIRALGWG